MQYYNPYFLIATCFGLGKIPKMPGTIGSILAFPVIFYCLKLIAVLKRYFEAVDPFVFTIGMLLVIILLLFVIGIFCASKYSQMIGKNDPQEIIIDEVVGQMLTVTLTMPFAAILLKDLWSDQLIIITGIAASFALFRLFDIFKPWPIGWLDKNVKGGFGIMLDDIAASVFAIVVYDAALLKLANYLGQ